MPYLIGETLAMYHVPKTAGIWARTALRAAGMPWFRLGDQHSDRPVPDRPTIMMVRHPVDWLRSFWMYHEQTNWQHYSDAPPFVFYACHRDGDSFETFVKRYLVKMPGAVGRMFDRYWENADCLIRVEDLPSELAAAIPELTDERFDANVILNHRRLNVSSGHMRGAAVLPAALHLDVVEAEEQLINRWYGGEDE